MSPIKSNTHKNYIIIKITAKQQLAQLQKESYSLAIKPGQIIIKAMDEAGVFYATRTLLQLIDQGAEAQKYPAKSYAVLVDSL